MAGQTRKTFQQKSTSYPHPASSFFYKLNQITQFHTMVDKYPVTLLLSYLFTHSISPKIQPKNLMSVMNNNQEMFILF